MHNRQQDDPIKLKCPKCGRFLADVRDFGRCVCRDCGGEVTYRSRDERRRDGGTLRVLTATS
jgi:ribosomal protein S27AE